MGSPRGEVNVLCAEEHLYGAREGGRKNPPPRLRSAERVRTPWLQKR
jgi:hypothetical protein